MKLKITMILLIVASIALWSDDLGDKQKQYEKLQQDLLKAESKIQQNEAKKKQKEADIQKTRQVKGQTEIKLVKARVEADKKLESLNSVKSVLENVEGTIQYLKSLQQLQLQSMVKINKANSASRVSHKNQYYLAVMAAQTRSKLDALGDTQVRLVEEENAKGSEYAVAKSIYQENYSTHKRLDNQVRNLETETKKLTKEQQQLHTQIANLKKASVSELS